MENCSFHAKEIQQVLTELYEVFDLYAVEEAVDYFENWQSWPRANLARSVEKDERTAPFSWCRPFVPPHRDNAGNMLAVNPLWKGGFYGAIHYLSERNQDRPFSGKNHCAGESYTGTFPKEKEKQKKEIERCLYEVFSKYRVAGDKRH